MPGLADKIIIDDIVLKAKLKAARKLAKEIEERNLLKEAEPIKEKFKKLCYPFSEGLDDVINEMHDLIDKYAVK